MIRTIFAAALIAAPAGAVLAGSGDAAGSASGRSPQRIHRASAPAERPCGVAIAAAPSGRSPGGARVASCPGLRLAYADDEARVQRD